MISNFFRGKSLMSGLWVVGCLVCIGEDAVIVADGVRDGASVDLATVGQDTGLRDADGREVFEWDILEDGDGHRMLIKRHDTSPEFVGASCYCLKKEALGAHAVYSSAMRLAAVVPSMRIVGNVFENPQLMGLRPEKEKSNDVQE